MDWSSLSCLFLVPVDAAAVPNMSLLLPQTASRFPSIDYRGFNHLTCLCSPLIECYFYKKDWVGKTGIGFNRDCLGFLGTWGTGLTSFQSKSQSKTSSTKARVVVDQIHFPEFQVTWFLQKLKLNDRSLLQVQSKRSKRSHQFNHSHGLP